MIVGSWAAIANKQTDSVCRRKVPDGCFRAAYDGTAEQEHLSPWHPELLWKKCASIKAKEEG